MILGCNLLSQHYIVGYRYSWMHDLNIRLDTLKFEDTCYFPKLKLSQDIHVGSDIRTFIWILLILKT